MEETNNNVLYFYLAVQAAMFVIGTIMSSHVSNKKIDYDDYDDDLYF
jgi:hypothetical protein